MRLRHPQQLLVHAPIASYYQYPRAIPVSAAPELQLYILLHFRRRVERGDVITNLTVDRHALLHGAWAMFVDLEQVISEHVTVLLTVDACRILKC